MCFGNGYIAGFSSSSWQQVPPTNACKLKALLKVLFDYTERMRKKEILL